MKIKEAIEIKKRQREGYTAFTPEQIDEADRLGTEALKEIKRLRQIFNCPVLKKLPGETEE